MSGGFECYEDVLDANIVETMSKLSDARDIDASPSNMSDALSASDEVLVVANQHRRTTQPTPRAVRYYGGGCGEYGPYPLPSRTRAHTLGSVPAPPRRHHRSGGSGSTSMPEYPHPRMPE